MAFSLNTLLGNWFHLRNNELGHSALGNAIVGVVDNTIDPALSSVVSAETGGLVTPTVTPATAPVSTTEQLLDQEIALFLGAALMSHNQTAPKPVNIPHVIPAPIAPPIPQNAAIQAQLDRLATDEPTPAEEAPPVDPNA